MVLYVTIMRVNLNDQHWDDDLQDDFLKDTTLDRSPQVEIDEVAVTDDSEME